MCYNKYMRKSLSPTKILAIGAMIILFSACFCSIFLEPPLFNPTLLPYPELSVPIINVFSFVLALVIFFFPNLYILQYIVLLIQTVSTCLTGYELLGCFLFNLFIFLFYIHSVFSQKKLITFFLIIYVCFIIILCGSIPYGLTRFIVALSSSLFISTAFLCIILLLKNKYHNARAILNQALYISPSIQLPKAGDTVYLSNFTLSQRQINILYEILVKNHSYGEVAIKFNLSLSLIKKEMSGVLLYFGCKNLSSLKLVFSQFSIKK